MTSSRKTNAGRSIHSRLWVIAVILLAGAVACRQEMADQPRKDPLEKSSFFEDGRSARSPVEGTVARENLRGEGPFYTGKSGGKDVTVFPLRVDHALLERGRERFNIFCSPCHDRVGNGRGMVVRRGFRPPPSFHSDRLRRAPVGHYFDVMTHGFGAMSDYAAQISPRDRWAIAAYIRVLQLSRHATLAQVPAAERKKLLENKP